MTIYYVPLENHRVSPAHSLPGSSTYPAKCSDHPSPPSTVSVLSPETPSRGKSRPSFTATASPPPFVATASPPPAATDSGPVPAPRKRCAVPVPPERPPVPAPQQRPPVPTCPSSARLSRASSQRVRASRAPPRVRASKVPPRVWGGAQRPGRGLGPRPWRRTRHGRPNPLSHHGRPSSLLRQGYWNGRCPGGCLSCVLVPTEPGFSQGFFLCSVTDGVLVPCHCCLWLAYLGTLHFQRYHRLDCTDTI